MTKAQLKKIDNRYELLVARKKLVAEYTLLKKQIEEECKKPNSFDLWLNGDNTISKLKARRDEVEELLDFLNNN